MIMCVQGCLQLPEILEITWNFIDASGKFNCQLKCDNMPITEPNLVMELTFLNSRNCHLTIFCAVLLPREATRSAVLPWHVVCPSVRPSVCLSVTLRYCDHIVSNSWKIISRLISLTISLSADPNMMGLLQREHPQILAGIGVG